MDAETITTTVMIAGIVGVIALVVAGIVWGRAKASDGGPYRKPRADVYTVMLIASLIAIILGIVCLYLEGEMYFWEFKNPAAEQGLRTPV